MKLWFGDKGCRELSREVLVLDVVPDHARLCSRVTATRYVSSLRIHQKSVMLLILISMVCMLTDKQLKDERDQSIADVGTLINCSAQR